MNNIVISLTTVPERLKNNSENGFNRVIKSLSEQNFDNYEVHLNIPYVYKITGENYIIPDWLISYSETNKKIKIFRTEDLGPITKVLPTIERVNDEDLIIVVDDDLIYHKDMVSEHVKYHKQLDNSVVLYDGRGIVGDRYNDLRDSWIICVTKPTRVSGLLQHYKSASYFRKYFQKDFFTDFLNKTKSDDVLMTYYFKFKKIKMYVVPYEPDINKLQTYDEWYKFQGVETFPVICHANSISNTGCNHPEMLKTEPKFFVPKEFSFIDKQPID